MIEILGWLNEPPPTEVISKLKEGDKEIDYIPIGQREKMLDEKFFWDTRKFRFQIYKAGNHWFASGSVLLIVKEKQGEYKRKLQGAATIVISSKDDNMHYESTILSLATDNASQKLGPRFGRELNGRMEVGETAFVNKAEAPVIDRSVERVKILVENAKSLEELSKHKDSCSKNAELYEMYNSKLKTLVVSTAFSL